MEKDRKKAGMVTAQQGQVTAEREGLGEKKQLGQTL